MVEHWYVLYVAFNIVNCLLLSSKIRTKVHFFRPRTLKLPRQPKYQHTLTPPLKKFDAFKVIKYPLTTESAMKKVEDQNTLVFIVDIRANKRQIKNAIKQLHNVDAIRVNTLIRPDGLKKAYIRLSKDQDALDLINKLGAV